MNSIFKKTVFISLLGHITVFSIFSFSFGDRFFRADYTNVSFRGAILRSYDLISSHAFTRPDIKKLFLKRTDISTLDNKNRTFPLISSYYLKPGVKLVFNQDKIIFRQKPAVTLPVTRRKESIIMFHPVLPYNFLLYFKDRQVVHIELMFNLISSGQTHSIVIKRKISSGNLEADLLSMRYISHYLFIQQARFLKNNWQTVKIELTPKND